MNVGSGKKEMEEKKSLIRQRIVIISQGGMVRNYGRKMNR